MTVAQSLSPGASQNLSKADVRRIIEPVMADWHPASQAGIHVLGTTNEFPAEIKKYATQEGVALSTIRGNFHKSEVAWLSRKWSEATVNPTARIAAY